MGNQQAGENPGKGPVLVDGAGGFLGSHLVETLCGAGWRVLATDLPASDLSYAREAGAEVAPGDLLEADRTRELVRAATHVVHVAGLFDYALPVEALRRANVEATRSICEACRREGVEKLVHVSSIVVYGRPETVPMAEDHPRRATNRYARTKVEGEDIALDYHRRHGLPVLSVRPAGIYGPRSRYGQAGLFALLALLHARGMRRIPLIRGGPRMHHVHVSDVCEAIRCLLDRGDVTGQAYNVADETPLSQGDLLRFAAEALGLSSLFTLPYVSQVGWPCIRVGLALPAPLFSLFNAWLAREWGRVAQARGLLDRVRPRLDRDYLGYMNGDYVLDTARLRALGFRPRYPSSLEGMGQTIAWYRSNRWLP